ncbi:hypothetical protein F5050DRAFT_1775455 [Lentinula boryana]|uniref:RRM domain-containing protein n=1 Tax=Lentinula boryana TaxID=40481 RepID=A0ABQ8Q705_9AGAR|nr:hypothetical protein F5050DRAFT_1775455 [Lentinula boryana]
MMSNNRDRVTSSTFHKPKQRVLGGGSGGNWRAANVAPAWRANAQSDGANTKKGQGQGQGQEVGSKILLSHLPSDVGEGEVEELFKKTIGPLKESFVIYNSQGRSKGMAVVVFQRPGDAVVARMKYNGKFVDGRRPIRIEIISDHSGPITIPSGRFPPNPHNSHVQSKHPQPLTLLDRIAKPSATSSSTTNHINNVHQLPRQAAAAALIASQPQSQSQFEPYAGLSPVASLRSSLPSHPRKRTKKGPRRLNKSRVEFPRYMNTTTNGTDHVKKVHKTKEQLDEEMEVYRAEREEYDQDQS